MYISSRTDIPLGVAGGVLVGVSSTAWLVIAGKVTGISGITSSAVSSGSLSSWRWAYLLGLVLTGVVMGFVDRGIYRYSNSHSLYVGSEIVAGLLVGFGSRLGSGCTSGHGLCGLARLSPRSLVAVLTFLGAGVITATIIGKSDVLRAAIFSPQLAGAQDDRMGAPHTVLYVVPTVVTLIVGRLALVAVRRWWPRRGAAPASAPAPAPTASLAARAALLAAAFACAVVFGIGLGVAGMTNPDRVRAFLDFTGDAGWDPTLMAVLVVGVVINAVSFIWLGSRRAASHPPLCEHHGFVSHWKKAAGSGNSDSATAAMLPPALDCAPAPSQQQATEDGSASDDEGAAQGSSSPAASGASAPLAPPCTPCAAATAATTYGSVIKLWKDPANMRITWQLVVGSALFGTGWGLGGVCPGPGIVALGGWLQGMDALVPAMFAGFFLYEGLHAARLLK